MDGFCASRATPLALLACSWHGSGIPSLPPTLLHRSTWHRGCVPDVNATLTPLRPLPVQTELNPDAGRGCGGYGEISLCSDKQSSAAHML